MCRGEMCSDTGLGVGRCADALLSPNIPIPGLGRDGRARELELVTPTGFEPVLSA